MADTIGLVGDGDDVDLLQAIEQSFQVRFGDETTRWSTIGDLHQALVARIAPGSGPDLRARIAGPTPSGARCAS
ncbi:hypothetical protein [Caulobacter sp.]|jgi:hypothetical protein|uniref:hypothetical protein n=1 Tax=Caulobacter sp. TaxID=78 RepID=UPI0016174CCA